MDRTLAEPQGVVRIAGVDAFRCEVRRTSTNLDAWSIDLRNEDEASVAGAHDIASFEKAQLIGAGMLAGYRAGMAKRLTLPAQRASGCEFP